MIRFCLLLSVGTVVLGCSGQLPAVKPPAMDAASAAQGAMVAFDADGDGVLSKSEACMGMSNSFARYDMDGDGSATPEEVKSRFEKWSDGDTGMMNLRVQVSHRGQPLTEATIEMTPYEFLGENFLPSEGKTDSYGYAFMAIPKDQLPESQQLSHGMQVGLYRVSISHPERKIQAKYNDETELSVDLSPGEANTGVQFRLK